jgi:hypothetical protein
MWIYTNFNTALWLFCVLTFFFLMKGLVTSRYTAHYKWPTAKNF